MKKALIILSGGQDSTTCLFWAMSRGYSCSAITFNYNQLHKIEIDSAIKIVQLAGVKDYEVIDIGGIFDGKSPLTNHNERLELHDNIEDFATGIQKTFVPARNLLFLSIAANKAYSKSISTVILGVCQEDFGGYPDCRQDFIDSVEKTISLSLEKKIDVLTPVINLRKSEIVKLVKDAKLKVQTAIQGDELRITGKKRDDLQQVISLVKSSDLGQPFQYKNFRD